MKKNAGILVLVFLASATATMAGTRLASVYLESIATMQSQLFQAAQLFEAPELGTAPMMMSMMIPGFSEIDKKSPLAVHMYAGDGGQFGVVIEMKPATTTEALLRALLAVQGGTLPAPAEGRYHTDQGAAQVHGDRVLLGRSADDLELALATGLPSALPTVAGMLRVDIAPAKVATILDDLEALALNAVPADAEQQAMLRTGMELYRSGLAQIASYQYGLGVTEKGLECRTRILPQAGRVFERIVASLQEVNPAWVAHLDGDHMFGAVSGAYAVPEHVQVALLDAYIAWMQVLPDEVSMDTDLIRAMFEPTLGTFGAPNFIFGGVTAGGAFEMLGGMLVDQPAVLLQKMIEITTSAAYQAQMQKSGMILSEPVVRVVDDNKVYRWTMEMDEDIFLQQMREAGAADAESEDLAQVKSVLERIFSGYDYAATAAGLVFGVTDDAGIAQAMQLLAAREGAPSALLDRIGVPVTPYVVARFDLLGFLQAVGKIDGLPVPQVAGKGEGVLFAGWKSGLVLEQVMLLPAGDIRMLRQAAMPGM